MSTSNNPVFQSNDIRKFYLRQLADFGDTSKGVGWKDEAAQNIRFTQLAKLFSIRKFSLNDLGCGTGKFYDYLLAEKTNIVRYLGYDILEEMIDAAKKKFLNNSDVELTRINSASEMVQADYSVCSGIFNVKYEATEAEWLPYILSAIESMNEKSKYGFAFNLLTKYSDREFMQTYLYYADPLFFFDYCKRNYSKNVALLHDYDQYDFTIIVRKP
jgi:SAM-dependent methyltransferase